MRSSLPSDQPDDSPQHWLTTRPDALPGRADAVSVGGHLSRPANNHGAEVVAWLERLEADDLRKLIASLPAIEQAKGVLMGYYAVSAPDAFNVLRRWSSVTNTKISVLAADITDAAAQPHADRYGGLAEFLRIRRLG